MFADSHLKDFEIVSNGHKGRCHPKSLALLVFNAVLALVRSAASFSVSHTEHVVCFHASVVATVAWDWVAKCKSQFLFVTTEELSEGLTFSLVKSLSSFLDMLLGGVKFFRCEDLFSWLDSVKFVDGARVNGLKSMCQLR